VEKSIEVKRIFLIPIFLLTFWSFCLAQLIVEGKVTIEEGTPAIGANVWFIGTYDGTITDADGRFQLPLIPVDSCILAVSYLGYETRKLPLSSAVDSLWLEIELIPVAGELSTVVITAGSFEASNEKEAVLLRPLDIVTTGGSNGNIVAALNTLPGTQTNAEDGRIFVRGGDARETQTFIDGLRVPNPYTNNAPDLPVRGRFSPFLFKGTSFNTGGYSAAFGQALSSALLLETKDLPDASVTSVSLMSIGSGLSHTERWKQSSISASVDYSNMGPYIRLVPQRVNWTKPVENLGTQLGFRHRLNNDGLLKVQVSGQRTGMAMQFPKPDTPEEEHLLELKNDNYYANATYRQLINDRWRIDGGMAFGFDTEDIEQDFSFLRYEKMMQGRLVATRYGKNDWKIKTGVEWIRERTEEAYISPGAESFHTDLTDDLVAAFLEGESFWGKKWALRAGLRSEYQTLLGSFRLAPRISLARKAGNHGQFSFAFGQFYQSPAVEWLRYSLNLEPERADHLLINYQYSHEGRSLRLEAYHKNYYDLVQFPSASPWLAQNTGEGYARGIDVFFRDQETIKYGDFWISYSFLDTERDYLDFIEPAMPVFASRHNLSVVYKHWINRLQTNIGITYTLGSPRPYDDPNTPVFNDGRTRTFQDLSVNASYLTELFGQSTIVHLSVTNVLGFEQSFGRRFSTQPNANGYFPSSLIRPPASRFFFFGVFVSIGEGQQFGN
jgi:hypothetical protein